VPLRCRPNIDRCIDGNDRLVDELGLERRHRSRRLRLPQARQRRGDEREGKKA
jgi:hypothetical protein